MEKREEKEERVRQEEREKDGEEAGKNCECGTKQTTDGQDR